MNPLEQRIQHLENLLAMLIKSDRYTVQKDIQMFDGRNLQLATGTGTKIGTTASQKLSFYGVAPVIQQATKGTSNVVNGSSSAMTVDAAAKGYSNAGNAYTISDIVGALKAMGILPV